MSDNTVARVRQEGEIVSAVHGGEAALWRGGQLADQMQYMQTTSINNKNYYINQKIHTVTEKANMPYTK
jgi:hypothetical protein